MKVYKKYMFAVLTGILLVVLSTFFYRLLTPSGNSSSKRSDFPVLKSPSMCMTRESSMEEQLEMSELVVDASVLAVYPLETRQFVPASGTYEAEIYEKLGITSSPYSVLKVKMKANEYIKGNAGDTFTMSIVAFGLESSPDFQIGNRFILTLKKYTDGTYTPVTFVSSYFFVAEDDKVYPAGEESWTQKFSGMELSECVSEFEVIDA